VKTLRFICTVKYNHGLLFPFQNLSFSVTARVATYLYQWIVIRVSVLRSTHGRD